MRKSIRTFLAVLALLGFLSLPSAAMADEEPLVDATVAGLGVDIYKSSIEFGGVIGAVQIGFESQRLFGIIPVVPFIKLKGDLTGGISTAIDWISGWKE